MLHGFGSNEADLFSFAAELPEEYYVISARAPYDMMYGSYAWYAINFDADENKFSDIGHAIEKYTNSQGKYGILQEYGGHGIGTEMHQEPHVLNFGKAGNGPEITPGFALAIEPMITRGTAKTRVLADEWTVVSQDNSRGAHFENTFAILPDEKPFVLTALDGGRAELAALGIEISSLLA